MKALNDQAGSVTVTGSDTPRADALVAQLQDEETPFDEAYGRMLELARELERETIALQRE